jgi:hypothetical protein
MARGRRDFACVPHKTTTGDTMPDFRTGRLASTTPCAAVALVARAPPARAQSAWPTTEVIERIHSEFAKALTSDEMVKTWNGLGAETPDLYGDAFGKFAGREVKRWAEVVKGSSAKMN